MILHPECEKNNSQVFKTPSFTFSLFMQTHLMTVTGSVQWFWRTDKTKTPI